MSSSRFSLVGSSTVGGSSVLRRDEGDVGAEHAERCRGAAGDTAVLDVADDRDPQPVEAPGAVERRAHGVGVEQRLRGVGVPAVAGVDHAGVRPVVDQPRRAARLVADHERVDTHRGDRLDRVAQALALVHARLADRERHRVGRQPLGGGLEAQPGARRVLEEHVAHGLAAQRRNLRVRPAVDLGHVVGEVEDAVDPVDTEFLDRQQRAVRQGCCAHEISTPSMRATTDSVELVGRFLPTKSGRIGSSRWPRSTSTASWTALGRP